MTQTANGCWIRCWRCCGGPEDEYGIDPMDSFVALRRGRIEKRTSSATSVKAKAVMAVMDQTDAAGNGGPVGEDPRSNADVSAVSSMRLRTLGIDW